MPLEQIIEIENIIEEDMSLEKTKSNTKKTLSTTTIKTFSIFSLIISLLSDIIIKDVILCLLKYMIN